MPYGSPIYRSTTPTYAPMPGAYPLIPLEAQEEIIKGAVGSPIHLTAFGLSSVIQRRRQFVRTVRWLRRSL